jgi:hypothetical protein
VLIRGHPLCPECKKPPTLASGGLNSDLNPELLFLDLIYAVAGLGLRGFDLEAVLLGGGREEAPDAMGKPIRGFLGLRFTLHLARMMRGILVYLAPPW